MSVMAAPVSPIAPGTVRPLVEVKNLGRVFDVSKPWLNRLTEHLPRRLLTAAAEVTFSINQRETFALVGESGSGKSTVAKMVVGLIAPTTGEVIIDGVSMSDRKHDADRRRLRRHIQMVFQDPYASLNPRWRALDIVAEPLRAFGIPQSDAKTAKQVGELLKLVGLDPADGTKYPHEFSGGQRQRIAIARALACNPEFIVCDEPTSALDVSVQAQILNLMRDLQDRFGLTYLFISHNLAVVRHMANRIGVMYLGRLVEVAPAREMFLKPKHPYTRMLLDAVPDLDLTGRKRKPVEGEVPNPVDPPPGCPFHPRCPFANARCRVEMPRPIQARSATVRCHAVEEGRI
jgi:peptide/nickel transport system ATP-binding protein